MSLFIPGKKTVFLVGGLLAAYLLVGFLLLPYVVTQQIPINSKSLLGVRITLEEMQFNPFTLELRLKNLHVPDLQGGDILRLGHLYFNIDLDDIFNKTLIAKAIHIDSVAITLAKYQDGLSNVQPLLEAVASFNKSEQTVTTSEEVAKPSSWLGIIQELAVSELFLNYSEHLKSDVVVTRIQGFSLLSNDIQLGQDHMAPFFISSHINETGLAVLEGSVSLQPFKLKSHLKLEEVPVVPYEGYVSQFATLDIRGGLFSLSGDLEFDVATETPQLQFQGHGDVQQFGLLNGVTKQPLISWKKIAVEDAYFSLSENLLRIETIDINELDSRIILNKKGQLNFQKMILVQDKSDNSEEVSNDVESTESLLISVDRVKLNNSKAFYADYALPLDFQTDIHDLNGEVLNVSSAENSVAEVDIVGTVSEFGYVKISGKLNPSQPSNNTSMDVVFKNIEMTELTPYSAKFAGYKLESGKLNLALNYRVRDKQIVGENDVRLDNINLGEQVDSPSAMQLPLRLALALLKDSNGQIKLDLPIKGDMANPDFSYEHLIWNTLGNVLKKIIAAPFSFLGRIIGIDADKLKYVEFASAGTEILPPEKEKLLGLIRALQQRPGLQLEILPAYDKDLDTQAMQKQKLDLQLKDVESVMVKQGVWEETKGIEQAIYQHYGDQFGLTAREELVTKVKQSNPEAKKAVLELMVGDQMRLVLQESIVIEENKLSELASKRAQSIRNFMISEGQIEDNRLKLADAKSTESKNKRWIKSDLSLIVE